MNAAEGECMEITELVQRMQNGDEEAFEDIFRLEYAKVFARVKSNMIGFDQSTVEDVTQDVFIKVYEKISTLENPEAFEAWIMRIARNTAINEIEKSKKITLFPMVSEEENITQEDLLENEYLEFKPEENLSQKEIEENLFDILSSLPSHLSLCLQMKEYDNMSYQDIADELGITLSVVKNNIFQCKKKIKIEMQRRKLYSAAPIFYFMWLYKQYVEGMEIPAVELNRIWKGIQPAIFGQIPDTSGILRTANGQIPAESLSQGVSGSAGSMAGSTAAKATFWGSFTSGKIVAVLTAVTITGIAADAIGVYQYTKNKKEEPEAVREKFVYVQDDLEDTESKFTYTDTAEEPDSEADESIVADLPEEKMEDADTAQEVITDIEEVHLQNEKQDSCPIGSDDYWATAPIVTYKVAGIENTLEVEEEKKHFFPFSGLGSEYGYYVIRQVKDVTNDGIEDLVLHFIYAGNNACDTLGSTYVYTINQESGKLERNLTIECDEAGVYKPGYDNAGALAQDGWIELNLVNSDNEFAVMKLTYENGSWVASETDGISSLYGNVNE